MIKLLLKIVSIFINFIHLVEEWYQQSDKYKWNQHTGKRWIRHPFVAARARK